MNTILMAAGEGKQGKDWDPDWIALLSSYELVYMTIPQFTRSSFK